MRILHITNNFPSPRFPIFGIFVKEQIDSLTDLGIVNEVFFINGIEFGKMEYIKAIFRLRKHLFENKYDIIHCHHSYSALTFVCSGKIIGKKCLLSYQNDPDKESGEILFRILYHFFDMIILKNKSPEISFTKAIYLPNGVNMKLFLPGDKTICKRQLGLEENKRYIVFMDSNKLKRTQKRVDRFNDTIKILKEKYLLTDIEPLILTNIERHLIPSYLCSSDLHLMTSDFEGSPNSVKECVACNIPVVSTPVGNVIELIGDIKGCYVSKSFNADELAELAYKALKMKHFSSRESITIKGLDIITVANKLSNLYVSLINKIIKSL